MMIAITDCLMLFFKHFLTAVVTGANDVGGFVEWVVFDQVGMALIRFGRLAWSRSKLRYLLMSFEVLQIVVRQAQL